MKKVAAVAAGVLTLSLLASPVDASRRGATFPGDNVDPPRSGLIIDDVMDVRQDRDRGRDNDIDVTNPGNADRCNENTPAGRNGRSDVDDDVPADVNC
jgi:hypothetical protein